MNFELINVYSWYGAEEIVKKSGLVGKDIRFSWDRIQRIERYFLSRGFNVALFRTQTHIIIFVSIKGFKQY